MFEKLPDQSIPSKELSDEEKKQKYIELCEGSPDALYILSASLLKKGKVERITTGSYADENLHGTMNGGRARDIALAELQHSFPESPVVAATWIKKEGPKSYARLTAEYLKNKGVSEDKIILQEKSYSTFTELIELIKLIVEKDWKHVAVVTNEFQIERAQAMLEHIHELHDPNGYWQQPEVQNALEKFLNAKDVKVTFVSAEKVLPLIDSRYIKVIDEARKLPLWEETIKLENEGARQIRDGEYWKNLPPTSVKQ